MRRSNRTKQDLASSLKQLMRTTYLNDITVQDIVNNSGISRHTFYYHFIDKQDLVQWVFRSEVVEPLELESNHFLEILSGMMARMQPEQVFYTRALESGGQNSFAEFFFETLCQMTLQSFRDAATGRGLDIPEENLAWVARYVGYAVNGIVLDWVRGGLKESPEEVLAPLHHFGLDLFEVALSKLSELSA
ncbi:MAG: TetR family transcriptional regulator [Clostridiales bacterium]|nr:TetR family transcriptional regulator [Clostridiales bacterium]